MAFIKKSTGNSLIVLLMGILIFQSLSNTDFVARLTTEFKFFTIIGAVWIIAKKDKITERLGLN